MSRGGRSPVVLALVAVASSLIVVLLLLEGLLRFLPVCSLPPSPPVDAADEVLRFQPNRDGIWSVGGLLRNVNRYHVNNDGFVNPQDYDPAAPPPLVAVIGDSFVEALMVPQAETIHARLAAHYEGRARVYSFGKSGAPLSQYLAYARWVAGRFHPAGLIINVVGNDFDESFRQYKDGPGMHFFAERPDGPPALVRQDYAPGAGAWVVGHSRLAAYLFMNLHIHHLPETLAGLFRRGEARYSGNTLAAATPERTRLGELAQTAFLELLPGMTGLPPERILLVVDANRERIYHGDAQAAPEGYADAMLRGIARRARDKGFAVIEMDGPFRRDYAASGKRFDWPEDGHWNGRGHALAAIAVGASGFMDRCLAKASPKE